MGDRGDPHVPPPRTPPVLTVPEFRYFFFFIFFLGFTTWGGVEGSCSPREPQHPGAQWGTAGTVMPQGAAWGGCGTQGCSLGTLGTVMPRGAGQGP